MLSLRSGALTNNRRAAMRDVSGSIAWAAVARTPQGAVITAIRNPRESDQLRTEGLGSGTELSTVRLGQITTQKQAMETFGAVGLKHLHVIGGLGIRSD